MEELNNIRFSDNEIQKVEELYFGGKSSFNAEQRTVIRCFTQENIQACPGSGKTTTLAAKLLLLKEKITSGNEMGICILTHTNVAVDIIKERLGAEAAAFYSNYPNFLGTIQSFVNKFLAIPAYKTLYGKSLEIIDDEVYKSVFHRRIQTARNALSYFTRKGIDDMTSFSFNIHNFDVSYKVTETEPIVGKSSNSYTEVERLKLNILREGYLKFDEAYALANSYLREHPDLKTLFGKRFPFVFLDEMQDTEEYQFDLLRELFGQNCILQTIGDSNQDIYGHYDPIAATWPASTHVSIATTSRFPQHIANILQKVSVSDQALIGEEASTPINPRIIVFDDSSIGRVKDKFAEIIHVHGLHLKERAIFKAVGARKTERLSLISYYPQYSRGGSKVREHYSTMQEYINTLDNLSGRVKNVKPLKEVLYSIVLQVLKIANVRDTVRDRLFTATSIERYLRLADSGLHNDFRLHIQSLCYKQLNGQAIQPEIISFINTKLLPHFGAAANAELNAFFAGSRTANNAIVPMQGNNIYISQQNGESVPIVFDTIHGVKGETHTATLYLETFTKTNDVEKILPLLGDTQKKTKTYIKAHKLRMNQAYVAMSRPTDLVCIAVHKDRINLGINWQAKGFLIEDVTGRN